MALIYLKEMIQDSNSLAVGLKECGESHINYKLYTSMERALGILLSGNIYLTNGSRWNDTYDRESMSAKGTYAICLSFSTRENIAMWMLYGNNHGKNGAMLNFSRKMMSDILNTDSVELGCFENGKFSIRPENVIRRNDFSIFLSDVIYTDKISGNKMKLTHADEHATVKTSIVDHDEVFHKNVAWKYENECRLIIKPSAEWRTKAIKDKLDAIRIVLPEKDRKELCRDRLIRSPVYSGTTDYGLKSTLAGSVNWDLD